MPLRFLLVGTLLLHPKLSIAAKANDMSTSDVNWLLSQIHIGEAQQNLELTADSLQKLIAIAPKRVETQCAIARSYFVNDEVNKATQILNKLNKTKGKLPSCITQLQVIARSKNEDKDAIQKAKLAARASQYIEARKIYNTLFNKGIYPNINYELEHLSWYAQDPSKWEQVNNGYQRLLKQYAGISRIEIAYARHLLRRNTADKKALDILKKYSVVSRYSNEVENIWLNTLENLPINNKTERLFQAYFSFYPFSSKGKLQYQDFKVKLKTRQDLLANPYYRLWLKGERLLEDNKLALAEPILLKALKHRPTDGAIMRSLGMLYLRSGENEKSYQYFTRAQQFTADFGERETLKDLAKTAKFWLYIRQAKDAMSTTEFKIAALKLNLADALEQDQNTVLYNKALLKFNQGQYSQAANIYTIVLKNDPLNQSALLGLLDIAELEQSEQALQSFYTRLSTSQKAQIRASYLVAISSSLRSKASLYSQTGELDKAEKTLKRAIELAPEQPWLYYDLAFIYQQKGLTKQARSLFNNVLWQFPLNSSLRYSHALYLRSIDDYKGALNTLKYVPLKARNEDIIALEQQLQLSESLIQSERYLNAKNKSAAIYHLSALEAQPLTPIMQAELSRGWYKIDEQKHALKLLENALTVNPDLSTYWHVLFGEWLLQQGDSNSIAQWFTQYTLPEPSSESEISQYVQLYNNYLGQYYSGSDLIAKLNQLDQKYKNSPTTTTALINANLALEQREAAIILYKQKVQNKHVIEPQALIAIAKAYRELGNDFQAKEVTQQAIAQTTAQESYVQRQIMSSLNEFNFSGDALYLAEQLVDKSPNDQELHYLAAQVADKFNENEKAKSWYKQTLSPNKPLTDEQMYNSLARVNDSDPWYVSGAKRELITQQNKNQAYIAIGVNFSGQTSTESDATLGAGLVPIEAYFPLWQGQGFVKVDPTTISAQTTRFDEQFSGSRYGQGALCIFTCFLSEISPEATGVDIGLGWQNDNWRLDIGTTPLGFLIEDIVWGINYADKLGDFGYSLEFEKRPVTSSVLSYSGLKDVNTGNIWGGVRSTGMTVNASHDLGGDWGFWASADFQLYKGQNVKNNQRYRVMGGTYYRAVSNIEREFTIGASLLHWAYESNLSEETWGHGGYYSPQNYVGLSVPLTYDARWGDNFVYRLKTGIAYSKTDTDAASFFPNDPLLQNEAQIRQLETGVNPFFESDSSAGISYNLEGSFEYRVTPHWSFGGYIAIDRSDFYEPNFGQLYLRYYFNPVYGTLEFPGTPIIPYADF